MQPGESNDTGLQKFLSRLFHRKIRSSFEKLTDVPTNHDVENCQDYSTFALNYCSFAYSALACLRMGMSGSASFQIVRKS